MLSGKKIVAVILFLLLIVGSSFAQTWQWARSAHGNNNEQGWSTASDAIGNVYLTGYFSSDTIIFGNDTLYGAYTIFIAKYDSSGNLLWAKNTGGGTATSIAVDAGDNAYIAGYFGSGTPVFIFGNDTLYNAGQSDILILKYDSSGNELWARSTTGGIWLDRASDIATDIYNDIYVTGSFASPYISFGSIFFFNAQQSSPYGSDFFIAKYDSSGNVIWAQGAGAVYDEGGSSITTDLIGNVYVAGDIGSAYFYIGSNILINSGVGAYDIFIAKYDSAGNVLWAKSAGSTNNDQPADINVDNNGNAYVTGMFQSPSIVFGNDTLVNSSTSIDIFIMKYDSSGTTMWARSAGGVSADYGTGITSNSNGNAYATGHFNNTITFGSFTFSTVGLDDIYIVKYDSSGNVLWAARAGGANNDNGNAICSDANGNVFVTGYFSSTSIIFGNDTLINADQISPYTLEIFIAKLHDPVITDIPDNTTSISQINLFPNPASNQLTIESSKFKVQSVEVYDVMGKRCLSALTPNPSPGGEGSASIDVSKLASGIYFVKVKTKEGESAAKFVKE